MVYQTIEQKVKRVKALERKIELLEGEREGLQDSIRKEVLDGAEDSIPVRFKIWMEHGGPKTDYIYLPSIISRSGLRLFRFDSEPLYPQRFESFNITSIADDLFYVLRGLGVVAQYRDDYEGGSRGITEEDVFDWMEKLMELEVHSIIYDW